MLWNKSVFSIGVSALGMAAVAGLVGCLGTQDSQSPSVVETPTDNSAAYEKELIQLKEKTGVIQDGAIRDLQSKYGIKPLTMLPENQLDPMLMLKAESQSPEKSAKPNLKALKKVAGDIYSGLNDVKRVYMEIIYMPAGSTIERTTSNLSSGADPIAVLWRYTNQTSDFKATGTVNPTGQHKNIIYAWNDDYSGLGVNSKISFTSSDAGYYAFMVFSYNTGTGGTATLTKRYKPAGGSWTQTTASITITGTVVRYSGPNKAPTFLNGTDTYSTGSDPWVFFWDFGNMRGRDNDDMWSDARTSIVYSDGSWYPASTDYNSKNCVLFTGYSTGGTATYSFYE